MPIQLDTDPIIESFRIDLAEPGATTAALRVRTTAWAGQTQYAVDVVDLALTIPPPTSYFTVAWPLKLQNAWTDAGYLLPT